MTPKFANGFRVVIGPRIEKKCGWENTHIGKEAIVEFSCVDKSNADKPSDVDYDTSHACYSLLICFDKSVSALRWYEEDTLELMCQNAEKGIKIITTYYDKFGIKPISSRA